MLQCWSVNPESRPPFSELERLFGDLLEEEESTHYIGLNEPYLRINAQQYRNGETDYLALMGVPRGIAPKPPNAHYINGRLV